MKVFVTVSFADNVSARMEIAQPTDDDSELRQQQQQQMKNKKNELFPLL